MSKDTVLYLEDPARSTYTPMEPLTVDATDGSKFTATGVDYWSASRDIAPVVMPNGIITGGTVTPGTAVDTVDVSGLTAYLNGVQVTVSAASAESVTRGVTLGFRKNAITVDNAGAITVIPGTEGAAFSETIGAVGGAPYIPVDSILIAMVYLTNTASAVVLETEIKQSRGRDMEYALYPTFDISYKDGAVVFTSNLPLIHTGDVPKAVLASYASVEILNSFVLLEYTDNFKVPEEMLTGTTVEYHNSQRLTDVAAGLTANTFDITFKDGAGIGTLLPALRGDKLWLICKPDKYKPKSFICPPAIMSFERDAIAASVSNLKATVTMMAEEPAIEVQI